MPLVGDPVSVSKAVVDDVTLVAIHNRTARPVHAIITGSIDGDVIVRVGGNDTFRGAYGASDVRVELVADERL